MLRNTRNTWWETFKPDPEREGRVVNVLEDCGVKDPTSTGLVTYLLNDLGLYSEPHPENRITAREIRKRARVAATEFERQDILSEIYQTVRGGRVIQVGGYKKRRPEVELTYGIRLIDYHFKKALMMRTNSRVRCIAKVFIAVGIYGFVGVDLGSAIERVRKRLERSEEEVDHTEYLLKLYDSQVANNPDNVPPFPLKIALLPLEMQTELANAVY